MADASTLITPEGLENLLGLTQDQLDAVTESRGNVVVTAGAGTGKTQTLVARYLWHLAQGLSPRQVAAITFTEKAAREMRNRIRSQVAVLARQGQASAQPAWEALEAQMDAARIGTIHSLCAEMLRAHPAQAEIDPGFDVVDEGWSAALKAQAVEDALAWAVGQPDAAQLFIAYRPYVLREILSALLDRRLDAGHAFDLESGAGWMASTAVEAAVRLFVDDPSVEAAVSELEDLLQAESGKDAMTASMAAQAAALVAGWHAVKAALADGRLVDAAGGLYDLRRESMRTNLGKKDGFARSAIEAIRQRYEAVLQPWLGGATARDQGPDPVIEDRFAQDAPRIMTLFGAAETAYRAQLDGRRALDFDDLEAGALRLLDDQEIRDRWNHDVQAVLVDEFQDTNHRQREIIEHLAGEGKGRLFVVGDARQSIYRFRGADVTVFRQLRTQNARAGGKTFDLATTFRTHAGLLAGLDEILGYVMGTDEGDELYEVPYTALAPHRPALEQDGPFLELVLGAGERAEDARPRAAQALCRRLLELKARGDIDAWDQVALLFRASTGFEDYERALEQAKIPFVTVAGRGFYDRPEIRDLLNTLSLLADPTDDLAMMGFLRSPAIGMSDPGVFALRVRAGELRSLRLAVADPVDLISPSDQTAAARAQAVLDDLLPWVDRLPVVALIKLTVDRLDMRPVLASSHSRLWRNVDKLIEDAQKSQVVKLTEFLAYLRTLRAVGAREGEAPAEAEGAVRLMTIHKAKGLEFDVAVLADASRRPPTRRAAVYVSPVVGVASQPDRLDGESLAYRLAGAIDRAQSDAESLRLLYVAATRARDRLIISGHLSQSWGRWAAGWMGQIIEALGLTPEDLAESDRQAEVQMSPQANPVAVSLSAKDIEFDAYEASQSSWPKSIEKDLFEPIETVVVETVDDGLDVDVEPDWRVTRLDETVPGAVLGRLVHTALQRDCLPGAPAFSSLIESEALRAGLVSANQRRAAASETLQLLNRLSQADIWEELKRADIRLHEIPFTVPLGETWARSGVIDLLYRLDEEWVVLDFKTDHLADDAAMHEAAQDYFERQVGPYVMAVEVLLGQRPAGKLCFLDVADQVQVVEFPA